MIDRSPVLIARCAGVQDVVACVELAAEQDLLVAMRGGGHNVAGTAVCDGGIVIDLARLREVRVDPETRTVRAEAGATWGDDNLVAAELVIADARVVRVSTSENPNLFWALRGGGGNFGVVTWFEYTAHPLGPEVYAAQVVYPFEQARHVLARWRAALVDASDEVTSDADLWSLPASPEVPVELHGVPVVIIEGVYAGPADEGERALDPLRRLGEPLLDQSGRLPYLELQSKLDALAPGDGRLTEPHAACRRGGRRAGDAAARHPRRRPHDRAGGQHLWRPRHRRRLRRGVLGHGHGADTSQRHPAATGARPTSTRLRSSPRPLPSLGPQARRPLRELTTNRRY